MALSRKHEQFVNEYLACMNATEAYRRVYPASSDVSARANATRLIANDSVRDAIDQRLAENTMRANEVLSRLTEHASGDMGDFWTISADGEPALDLNTAKANGKLRLIKKLKVKTTRRMVADIEEVTTDVDFELYDAQSALKELGRYHKIFTDKTEISGKDGGELIAIAVVEPGLIDLLK
jgi:phage terminase small subunit